VNTEEAIACLHSDPNFIGIRRFEYSLEHLLQRFPEGAPDATIAKALLISVEDVDRLYQQIVEKLKLTINQER
jgi:hypothetical protein